jgi:hypothetical protein
MKKLLLAAIALTANVAVGATSITVHGYGPNRESAKRDAFRTAIENVCGTVVLSDREHFNDKTTHNRVISYSSCRIEKYEILEEKGNELKMKVTVKDNRIANRLYSQSGSRLQFDGNTVKAQIDSIKQEQKNGDLLIDEIFRDYPYRAYDLQPVQTPYITMDPNRNVFLVVPYDIKWNYNFITAMNEMFHSVKTSHGSGRITVTGKNPNFYIGHRNTYVIDDLYRLDYIKSKFMNQNELRLNVKARNHKGNQVLNICYNPDYKAGGIFYSIGVHRDLTIFGNDRNAGSLRIKLTFPAEVIYDIYVDVVAARDCKL